MNSLIAGIIDKYKKPSQQNVSDLIWIICSGEKLINSKVNSYKLY